MDYCYAHRAPRQTLRYRFDEFELAGFSEYETPHPGAGIYKVLQKTKQIGNPLHLFKNYFISGICPKTA